MERDQEPLRKSRLSPRRSGANVHGPQQIKSRSSVVEQLSAARVVVCSLQPAPASVAEPGASWTSPPWRQRRRSGTRVCTRTAAAQAVTVQPTAARENMTYPENQIEIRCRC